MNHLITITIPIDPTEYADSEDTLNEAMTIANEIIFHAADVPDNATVHIAPSNHNIVQTMAALLLAWSEGPRHQELEQLRENTRVTLLNLRMNEQQTKEAKEI